MSEMSDFTKEELLALAEAVDLWDQLVMALGKIEAHPRDYVLHIETEMAIGYLGWIGTGEHGAVSFQPAPREDG